ncbi:MAG: response regulator transcription factor [Oscillospiraceae bacterium]|nr:response regulator transcription factor [Oscillospiraceae bacterium]
MANVLIADDSREFSTILKEYVEKEGYSVFIAGDGRKALEIFSANELDMVFLDVNMPVMNGYDVCREIRKKSNVPVIMITSHGDDYEKIMGLGIGADDYVVKPCSPGEVIARMRAILRRIYFEHSTEQNGRKIQIDNLEIDIDNFKVCIDKKEVLLTKKEMEILWTLAENADRVFTRENLLNSLWGYDYYGDCRTVDSHIKRLRAKLDEFPHENWNIKTVWGMGYKFEVNVV